MPKFITAVVDEVLEKRDGFLRVSVKIGRRKRQAVAYTSVTGPIAPGDRVVLNATAVSLGLGTGGDDFVVWNAEHERAGDMSGGHILKMRYTPMQLDVVAAEAAESPHHDALKEANSLGGMPVVACGLHSQIAPVAAALKHFDPDVSICYVMTDGGALPLAVSELVGQMREKKLIDSTITCGHSFGGDLECINVYSALVAASDVLLADVAIVCIGPGIVGTGTSLGHTGMDQGLALSAAGALGGQAIACLRISFADNRERHQGVSHHTLNALRFGALIRSTVAVPDLPIAQLTAVMDELQEAGIPEMHDLTIIDAWETQEALERFDLEVKSMGRGFKDDPAFFEAAGAAGVLAARVLYGEAST